MSGPALVVINFKMTPWQLTRFVGPRLAGIAQLVAPKGCDVAEVKQAIEQFRVGNTTSQEQP